MLYFKAPLIEADNLNDVSNKHMQLCTRVINNNKHIIYWMQNVKQL